MVAEGFTWGDQSGRSLTLSGQINPAFNVVDDGISTDVFIVDNDTSGTRFRLDADAPLGETSIGATLEIGASPNNSYDVSQLDSRPTPTSTSAAPRSPSATTATAASSSARAPAPPTTPPSTTCRWSPARSCTPASPTSPAASSSPTAAD